MRTAHRALVLAPLLVGVLGSTAIVFAQGSGSELGWLAGCWEQQRGGVLVEEQWTSPRGGGMFGISRTTRGDSLLEFEFMRIRSRGDSVFFAAQPSGQAPSEFPGSTDGPRSLLFSNPAHDFPQRIRYRAVGDSLHARIEGTLHGRERSVDFRYARVACAGPAARGT